MCLVWYVSPVTHDPLSWVAGVIVNGLAGVVIVGGGIVSW